MVKVSLLEGNVYRGVHPVYGQIAGTFLENGKFLAHQTGPGGSFFSDGAWAEDGFEIDSAVIDDTAEWYQEVSDEVF